MTPPSSTPLERGFLLGADDFVPPPDRSEGPPDRFSGPPTRTTSPTRSATSPDRAAVPPTRSATSPTRTATTVATARDDGTGDVQAIALARLRERALPPAGPFTSAELAEQGEEVRDFCRAALLEILSALNDESLRRRARRAFDEADGVVADALLDVFFGLGRIERLFALPGIEDIALNGPGEVLYYARDRWHATDIVFDSPEMALGMLNRAIDHEDARAGRASPIVDAVLKKGQRLSILTDPIASPSPAAVIRIREPRPFSAWDMLRSGGEVWAEPDDAAAAVPDYFGLAPTEAGERRDLDAWNDATDATAPRGLLTPTVVDFLHKIVIAGWNIIVLGRTGVGKTALLSMLGNLIPRERRIVVIEDTPELAFRVDGSGRPNNVVYLRASRKRADGARAYTQQDLLEAALRQRPDAIVMGEARGAEVHELLNVHHTGHRNGLTSIHAHSVAELPRRIKLMLNQSDAGRTWSEAGAADLIASAFDLGITLTKVRGQRQVQEIVEFTGGVEGSHPVLNPLFVHDARSGRLRCTGHGLTPLHERLLADVGFGYHQTLDAARRLGDLIGASGAGR